MDRPILSQRTGVLQAMAAGPLDVLIIGGGIVGAGIARDAAMRGLRVGLVEQFDFAFGTSGRSSRLLHGGLRYLAQGRVGLVREASVEKKIISRIAPHLAEPLGFVFPVYEGNREWKLWKLKIGVKLYDLLCGGRNLGASSWMKRQEALATIPALRGEGLAGAVRYYDALTNDARLVLDTLRSAGRHGAGILNYCRFEAGNLAGDTWECQVTDAVSGANQRVVSRAIVNATGPWAEGLGHSRVKLRLTKGVHLIVERARVPVADAVVMTEGKRILFAIPWGERTILGTTDTDYHGPIDRVHADGGDVEYILKIVNQHFPTARLEPRDLISTWAGLRPLIAEAGGRPGDISRSHRIERMETNWWDVAGGKLTTYRLMAEQTVNQIVKALGLKGPRSTTAAQALLPAEEMEGISGIIPPPFTREAVEHYCRNEWAMHLDDLMVRRTSWHYYFADAAQRADQVAQWMAGALGWDEAMKGGEVARYAELTRA